MAGLVPLMPKKFQLRNYPLMRFLPATTSRPPSKSQQLLTLTIPKPAVDKPYTLEIAGVEGQSIEVIVP